MENSWIITDLASLKIKDCSPAPQLECMCLCGHYQIKICHLNESSENYSINNEPRILM